MKVIRPTALQALADARRSFKDVPLAHLSSLLADGTPHVVPLWFVWLEEGIVVTCRRPSQVWTNVARDPRVALEVERGRAWVEQSGILVRGRAEPLSPEASMGKRALSAWFDKYSRELSGPGFAAYTEQVMDQRMLHVRVGSVGSWFHGSYGPAARP